MAHNTAPSPLRGAVGVEPISRAYSRGAKRRSSSRRSSDSSSMRALRSSTDPLATRLRRRQHDTHLAFLPTFYPLQQAFNRIEVAPGPRGNDQSLPIEL